MPLLRSLQHYHLTCYGLPTHDALFLDRQLMMNLTICDHIIL